MVGKLLNLGNSGFLVVWHLPVKYCGRTWWKTPTPPLNGWMTWMVTKLSSWKDGWPPRQVKTIPNLHFTSRPIFIHRTKCIFGHLCSLRSLSWSPKQIYFHSDQGGVHLHLCVHLEVFIFAGWYLWARFYEVHLPRRKDWHGATFRCSVPRRCVTKPTLTGFRCYSRTEFDCLLMWNGLQTSRFGVLLISPRRTSTERTSCWTRRTRPASTGSSTSALMRCTAATATRCDYVLLPEPSPTDRTMVRRWTEYHEISQHSGANSRGHGGKESSFICFLWGNWERNFCRVIQRILDLPAGVAGRVQIAPHESLRSQQSSRRVHCHFLLAIVQGTLVSRVQRSFFPVSAVKWPQAPYRQFTVQRTKQFSLNRALCS